MTARRRPRFPLLTTGQTAGTAWDVTLDIKEISGGVHLRVHVKPRASKNAVGDALGDALSISVSAPPADGAANDAVVSLLARHLGIPRRCVTLVRGQTSRTKIVRVEGLDASAVLERLGVQK